MSLVQYHNIDGQKRTPVTIMMLYRATTGTIGERADATTFDEGSASENEINNQPEDSASLLYDQPYDDENNSYYPHDDIHSIVMYDPHELDYLKIPVSELVTDDLADEFRLLGATIMEECRAGLRPLLMPPATTYTKHTASTPPLVLSSSGPAILRTKVFTRRNTVTSSSLKTRIPTTPISMLTEETTTTPSMANNASVEVIVGRKTKHMGPKPKPSHQLASLFSSWRVPSVFSKQQPQQELRAALSRPNVTLLSAAIEDRHVIVDNEETDGTEEVVYDSSHDWNPISSMYESHQENDNTEDDLHNPMTILTTAEAIELQTHPPRQESNCTQLAPTTVCTTYHVIETPDHTEVVVIDGASTERMTTTHISEEEDGGWVARPSAKLEDGKSTDNRDDQRAVVRGEGSISQIPTMTGHDPEENHEVSVEEYSRTTMMVSTHFHAAAAPDSVRTENNRSFPHREDRRRVHSVEGAAIDEDRHPPRHPPVAARPKGIDGDDDPSPPFPMGDTLKKEHTENRNHIRPSARGTPSPRPNCVHTDGTTRHGVTCTRMTVPRVGQHRGIRKNRRPSDEKTQLQPYKRTRR